MPVRIRPRATPVLALACTLALGVALFGGAPAHGQDANHGCAIADTPAPFPHAPSALVEPLVVPCDDTTGAVVLDVRRTRVLVDGQVAFDTRLYFYADTPYFPAPTIAMTAGQQCQVTIRNQLEPNALVLEECNNHAPYNGTYYLCCDGTNLHMHGLHVSQDDDNINTNVYPGQSLTYTYHMPANHLMGTHWYHAHRHGSSQLQVSGGLHGALLVRPAADYTLPADLAPLYTGALSATHSHLMVLSLLFFNPVRAWNRPGDGADPVEPGGAWDFPPQWRMGGSPNFNHQTIPLNCTIYGNHTFMAVNGQYQPYVVMRPNDVHLFKVINTAAMRYTELELVDPNGWCEVRLIARDGVFQYTPYQRINATVLGSGNRADIAIKCAAAAAGTNITVRSYPAPFRDRVLGQVNRMDQPLVWTLVIRDDPAVPATPANTVAAFPTSQAPLPTYLADVWTQPDTEVFTGPLAHGVMAFAVELADDGSEPHAINGAEFPGFHGPVSARYVDKLCVGTTYQFLLTSPDFDADVPGEGKGRSLHPYHQHINHFQIVDVNNANADALRDVVRLHEWRDTVPVLYPGGVTIRFRPHDYAGDTILHCHILHHEDEGMMGLFLITNDQTQCAGARAISDDATDGLPTYGAVLIAVSVTLVVVSALCCALMRYGLCPASAFKPTGTTGRTAPDPESAATLRPAHAVTSDSEMTGVAPTPSAAASQQSTAAVNVAVAADSLRSSD